MEICWHLCLLTTILSSTVSMPTATVSTTERPVVKKFSFRDCGNKHRTIKINRMDMGPSPIEIPGTVTIQLNANVTKRLPNFVRVEMKLQKRYFQWFWGPVPCVQEFGSCTFDKVNVCASAEDLVQCPITAKHYSLQQSFNLPDIGRHMLKFIEGDYKAVLRVKHPNSRREFGCLKMEFSISGAPEALTLPTVGDNQFSYLADE